MFSKIYVVKNTSIFWKHLEKSCVSVIFALIFQKNLGKVWNIEKIWNIKAKKKKSQLFSMFKFLDGQAYFLWRYWWNLEIFIKSVSRNLNEDTYLIESTSKYCLFEKKSQICQSEIVDNGFFYPFPHHIDPYRQFATPSSPQPYRRLLWTAPMAYAVHSRKQINGLFLRLKKVRCEHNSM